MKKAVLTILMFYTIAIVFAKNEQQTYPYKIGVYRGDWDPIDIEMVSDGMTNLGCIECIMELQKYIPIYLDKSFLKKYKSVDYPMKYEYEQDAKYPYFIGFYIAKGTRMVDSVFMIAKDITNIGPLECIKHDSFRHTIPLFTFELERKGINCDQEHWLEWNAEKERNRAKLPDDIVYPHYIGWYLHRFPIEKDSIWVISEGMTNYGPLDSMKLYFERGHESMRDSVWISKKRYNELKSRKINYAPGSGFYYYNDINWYYKK